MKDSAPRLANPVAGLNAYELRHLAAHLEAAMCGEDLHRLLALTTAKGRNAWHETKETSGDEAGYIADIQRAWKLAEEQAGPRASDQAALPTEASRDADGERQATGVGRQCRYALIAASLNSLSQNIPPSLLSALVATGLWSPERGLTFARQVPEPEARSRTLVGLAPHLSQPLLGDVLTFLAETPEDKGLGEALIGLTPYLKTPALVTQALTIALELKRDERISVLVLLCPHLSREQLAQVHDHLRKSEKSESKAVALAALVPYLPPDIQKTFVEEALTIARRTKNAGIRARVLADLAPDLADKAEREQALREALRIIAGCKTDRQRSQLLVGLGPSLTETLLEKVLLSVKKTKNAEARIRALVGLAGTAPRQSLRVPLVKQALRILQTCTGDYVRSMGLVGLGPYLEGSQLEEALAVARRIRTPDAKAPALLGLAPHLGPSQLQSIRTIGQRMKDPSTRATLLAALVPLVSAQERSAIAVEAFESAQAVSDPRSRIEALVTCAHQLPETERLSTLRSALQISRELGIDDVFERAQARCILALYLSETERRAVLRAMAKETRAITNPSSQEKVLEMLVPVMTGLGDEEGALEVVGAIPDDDVRLHIVSYAISHFSQPFRERVLQTVPNVYQIAGRGESWKSTELLLRLVPFLPKDTTDRIISDRVQELTRIGGFDLMGGMFNGFIVYQLAPYLTAPQIRELLSSVRMLPDEFIPWIIDGGLIPLLIRLAELGAGNEALSQAQRIADLDIRARIIVSILPHLTGTAQTDAVAQFLDWAQKIEDLMARAKVVAYILPHLTGTSQVDAVRQLLDVLPRLEDSSREIVTEQLVPVLVTLGRRQEAVQLALAVRDNDARARLVESLLPRLPEGERGEVVQQAFAAMNKVRSRESARVLGESYMRVLDRLLPYLDESSRVSVAGPWIEPETLSQLATMGIAVPTSLIGYVPDERKGEVLREVLEFALHANSTDLLQYTQPSQPVGLDKPERKAEYWFLLSGKSAMERMLLALAPLMAALAGTERNLLWCETLHQLSTGSRPRLLGGLAALGPVIVAMGGQPAVSKVIQTIAEVADQFSRTPGPSQ